MLYNKILENAILPLGDKLLGNNFIQNLRKWRKIQTMSEQELEQMQKENLQKLLKHATTKSKYYSQFKEFETNDPYIWLSKFPVLTKKILRERGEDLLTKPKEELISASSSGSSGFQSTVYLDKENIDYSRSLQILWWEWGGYKFGNKILQTGITPERGMVKSLKDFLLRTTYLQAFNMSESDAVKVLKNAKKSGIEHFCGYASSIYLLAKIAKDNNIKNIKLKSVISWGDKMFPHFRSLIEDVFQTKVFDTYGCGEGIMIGAQKDKQQFYIMSPHVVVELLDAEWQPVKKGELGRVVVTRLDNFSMPMIRYFLGDLAVAGEKKPGESYELNFPILERVVGRDTDIVRTESGKYMVVHAFTGIFEFVPEIKQFRVLQDKLSEITIEIIPDNGFTEETEVKVRKKIQSYLKEDFPVHFKIVDQIPATPSGKPQIIQSSFKF